MGIEGINISSSEVLSTASSIKTINNNLTTTLGDIGKEMNELAQAWQSDASETIRQRFKALEPKIAGYNQVVESYSKFLENTVKNYEAVEASINSNASAFK